MEGEGTIPWKALENEDILELNPVIISLYNVKISLLRNASVDFYLFAG